MQLRMRGWTGLVVSAAGLALVGLALYAGDKTPQEASTAPVEQAQAATVRPQAPAAETLASMETTPAADQADNHFVIKRILPISGPIRYGEWHWDDADIPTGPLVVTVDLEARVLSVFQGGYEIGATAVLLGTQDKPTPTGHFPVTEKDADHVSNIYTGAPMPYMLRLTNDGISIHGTKVENGYASHGCIGVPTPFAEKLFRIAKLGTPVYITDGKSIGMGDSLVG